MSEKSYRIYLDVCCLNRLYDDQNQSRVRLETEAISEIMANCQLEKWELVVSTVLESEIGQIPSSLQKEEVRQALSIAKNKIILTQKMITRAVELTQLGFKKYDALHLASAENNADIFLSTDDRLVRKGITYRGDLNIIVANPVKWLLDIDQSKGEEKNDSH